MPQQLPQARYLALFISSLRGITELTSLGLLIGILIHLQRRYQRDNERLLLQKVGNPGFSPAAAEVTQLYREGKLSGEDSVLRGKNLMGANWQRAILPEANLEGANLKYADLRDVLLERANLTKADFRYANMIGANLAGAKMTGTHFMKADLRRAILGMAQASGSSLFMTHAQRANMAAAQLDYSDLQEADLHGAYMMYTDLSKSLLRDTNFAEANLEKAILGGAGMMNANLTGAKLSGAYFNEKTILPDAQFVDFDKDGRPLFDKYWTPDTDMARYTDPNHLDFWQPVWVQKYDWVKRNYEED